MYFKCLYIKVLSGWFETAVWTFEVISPCSSCRATNYVTWGVLTVMTMKVSLLLYLTSKRDTLLNYMELTVEKRLCNFKEVT